MSKVSDNLVNRVAVHEGFSSYVYLDAKNFISIGYGLTVGRLGKACSDEALFPEGVGLTEPQARVLLRDRLNAIETELQEHREADGYRLLVWSDGFEGDRARQFRSEVLIEMAYQMGMTGLLKFKKMWRALSAENYRGAAHEMLDSLWAKQTPNRAEELAEIMRTGKDCGA